MSKGTDVPIPVTSEYMNNTIFCFNTNTAFSHLTYINHILFIHVLFVILSTCVMLWPQYCSSTSKHSPFKQNHRVKTLLLMDCPEEEEKKNQATSSQPYPSC